MLQVKVLAHNLYPDEFQEELNKALRILSAESKSVKKITYHDNPKYNFIAFIEWEPNLAGEILSKKRKGVEDIQLL